MQRRGWQLAAALAVLLAMGGEAAQAQYGYYYPGGYGGWRGWGGAGSTAFGSEAMGMGMFAQGVGEYNVNTAQARAINAQTLGMMNEYMYEAQQVRNYKYYQQLKAHKANRNMSLNAIYQRLRDQPDDYDIQNGDALNVALNQINDPKVYAAAMKEAQAPVPPDMIRNIPFDFGSEAVTISLSELTNEEDWPLILRDKSFAKQREAFEQAVKTAMEEDDKGELSLETIAKVRQAVQGLKEKVETLEAGSQQRIEAENHVKALAGLTRMLQKPDVDHLLKGLEDYKGTTLADLLAFMRAFNLRFGAATNDRQRAIYEQLFPMLDSLRDAVLEQSGVTEQALAENSPPRINRSGFPTQFFEGMTHEHINAPNPPAVPQARTAPQP